MAAGDVAVSLTNPVSESCASFDGVDDKLENSVMTLNTDLDFSVSCFVKFLAFEASNNFIDINNESVTAAAMTSNVTGSMGATIVSQAGASNATGGIQATLNTWHHAAMTKNSSNLDFYLDGVAATTKDISATTDWRAGSTFVIARNRSVGAFAKILVRDVRLYEKKLTQAEVTRLANNEDVTDKLINKWSLNGNGNDSIGGKNFTATGAVFVKDSGAVDTAITTQRTTIGSISGNYFLVDINNKNDVLSVAIDEFG